MKGKLDIYTQKKRGEYFLYRYILLGTTISLLTVLNNAGLGVEDVIYPIGYNVKKFNINRSQMQYYLFGSKILTPSDRC